MLFRGGFGFETRFDTEGCAVQEISDISMDPPDLLSGRGAGSVLGVGIATLDLINEVVAYPAEDEEVRALAQRRVRGGNVANSLTVLSQLGHACRWVGTLGDDAAADLILADLAGRRVETRDAVRVPGGSTPTSYVALSRANGSRTIVHFRDLPELDAEAFDRVSLDDVAWVHFEGRNPPETRRMIRRVRAEAPHVPVSVELEKRRPGIECLLEDGPRLLLASRAFALPADSRRRAIFWRTLLDGPMQPSASWLGVRRVPPIWCVAAVSSTYRPTRRRGSSTPWARAMSSMRESSMVCCAVIPLPRRLARRSSSQV
jgi:hypothetical protein